MKQLRKVKRLKERIDDKSVEILAEVIYDKMMSDLVAEQERQVEENFVSENGNFCLLWNDIKLLNFGVFFTIMTTGDKSGLIVKGEPTEEQLDEAWSNILIQYHDAKGDENAKKYIALNSEVNRLTMHINWISHLLESIKLFKEKGLMKMAGPIIDAFHNNGYERSFSDKTYNKDIRFVEKGEKYKDILLQRAKKEYEDAFGSGESKAVISEKDFRREINIVRKHERLETPISKMLSEWTVSDYVTSYNDFREQMEQRIENKQLQYENNP